MRRHRLRPGTASTSSIRLDPGDHALLDLASRPSGGTCKHGTAKRSSTSRPIRSGTRTRSSTSCTSSRSSTPTTTASATSPGCWPSWITSPALGVNTIWLLPFYPSPRRDDGYDIAGIPGNVSPDYGTIAEFKGFDPRGARARPPRHHRARHQPHLRPASLVPARAPAPSPARRRATSMSGPTPTRNTTETRIIFIDTEKSNWTWDPVAGAYFWHRFYSHQPDLNFDNPHGAQGSPERHAVLAGHGHRRPAARRDPLSDRARGHEQREPARDPRGPEGDPRGARCALSGPPAARRGQPMAGGHAGIFRRRRRMPHGVPLPADAAHVHGDRQGGPLPDHRHPAPDAGDPGQLPMGDLPPEP